MNIQPLKIGGKILVKIDRDYFDPKIGKKIGFIDLRKVDDYEYLDKDGVPGYVKKFIAQKAYRDMRGDLPLTQSRIERIYETMIGGNIHDIDKMERKVRKFLKDEFMSVREAIKIADKLEKY